MKHLIHCLSITLLLSFGVRAAITATGADGSDGALSITADTVIDLSQAETASWDTAPAVAGTGVYDADQWAVVFKYSSVTIDPGMTLSFTNHPSRAPLVWLVNGDVTIDGTLTVKGGNRQSPPNLSEPGPGGFRGGTAYYTSGIDSSAGFGVGGGKTENNNGYGGSYGTAGSGGPPAYGNPSLIPLIGGSGGGGGQENTTGGGAGGGAILIVCTGTLTVNGTVIANGGDGRANYGEQSGGGAGGAIRVVCDTLSGTGSLTAIGGGGAYPGGLGRIRIERVTNDNTITVTPDPSVLGLTGGDTALVWPPAGAPIVKILSIGGETVPADPRASFGTEGADTVLPQTATAEVVIETENVEAESEVIVRVTPRSNATYTEVIAVRDEAVVTDPYRWTADIPVNNGYSAVQVKVTRP